MINGVWKPLLSFFWKVSKIVGAILIIFGVFVMFHVLVHANSKENLYDTVEGMKVVVDEIGRKFEDGISLMRNDFDERMEKRRGEINMKLKAIKVRSDVFEKFMDGLETRGFLSKEEFGNFYEDFIKTKKKDDTSDISERDYALGGGKFLRHLEPYGLDGKSEKMIRPSFGELGQCFPLKGKNGLVEAQGCHCTRSCEADTCC